MDTIQHRRSDTQPDDGNGKTCGVDCACSHGECSGQRGRGDLHSGEEVAPLRSALATQLRAIGNTVPASIGQKLLLAAGILERDEATNAEMIDVLVRAGYRDIPRRVNQRMIQRLLGYITPQ